MNGHETLSRRNFLRAAGTALVAFGVESCTTQPISSEQKPTATATATATGTAIPQELIEGTPRAQINATVQALKDKKLQTSFVPEGDFTEDLYKQVAQATFQIDFIREGKKGVVADGGTAWCFKKEGNTIYFLTNRHVIANEDDIFDSGDIYVVRPPEKSLTSLTKVEVISSNVRDIAILKAYVPNEYVDSIEPLPYADNYPLTKGEQVLIVGWPEEYLAAMALTESFQPTSASIVRAEGDAANGEFWTQSLVDHGSSGSPIVISQNGQPLVIGIIRVMTHEVSQKDKGFTSVRKAGGLLLDINDMLIRPDDWISLTPPPPRA